MGLEQFYGVYLEGPGLAEPMRVRGHTLTSELARTVEQEAGYQRDRERGQPLTIKVYREQWRGQELVSKEELPEWERKPRRGH